MPMKIQILSLQVWLAAKRPVKATRAALMTIAKMETVSRMDCLEGSTKERERQTKCQCPQQSGAQVGDTAGATSRHRLGVLRRESARSVCVWGGECTDVIVDE
jgi:hypothetical protein